MVMIVIIQLPLVPVLCVGCLRNCLRRAAGPFPGRRKCRHLRIPRVWWFSTMRCLLGSAFRCLFGFDREGVAWSRVSGSATWGLKVCRAPSYKGTSHRGPWRLTFVPHNLEATPLRLHTCKGAVSQLLPWGSLCPHPRHALSLPWTRTNQVAERLLSDGHLRSISFHPQTSRIDAEIKIPSILTSSHTC